MKTGTLKTGTLWMGGQSAMIQKIILCIALVFMIGCLLHVARKNTPATESRISYSNMR